MKMIKHLVPLLLVLTFLVTGFVISGGCNAPDKSDPFIQLLGMIPAIKDVKDNHVIIYDYALALESLGISLAELDEKSISFREFTDILHENSVNLSQIPNLLTSFITGWGEYADTGLISDKNVGYSFTSTDAYIQAGSPPNLLEAARNKLK